MNISTLYDTCKKYSREIALVVFVAGVSVASLLSIPTSAQITPGGNIFNGRINPSGPLQTGVWSGNVGWISLNNCSDATAANCTSVPYGISLNEQTGYITGSAWSSNVGWISFNAADTAACPGGAPRLASVGGSSFTTLRGSARVLNGGDPYWNGCISLSSSNPGYTPNVGQHQIRYVFGTKEFFGEAWGGPVVGWVGFNAHVEEPVNVNQPLVIFDANPNTIGVGQTTNLEWTTQYISSCVPIANTNDPSWSSASINPVSNTGTPAGGTWPTGNLTTTTTYQMSCIPSDPQLSSQPVVASATVTVTQDPIILTPTLPVVLDISTGVYSTSLYWNSIQNFSSCTLYRTNSTDTARTIIGNGGGSYNSPNQTPVYATVPANPTYYVVECSSPVSETSNVVEVYQTPLAPSVDVSSSSCVSSNTQGWIAWQATDVSLGSCVFQSSVQSINGSAPNALSGVATAPAGSYTLTCTNPITNQSISDSTTIVVQQNGCVPNPPPEPPIDPDIIFEEF